MLRQFKYGKREKRETTKSSVKAYVELDIDIMLLRSMGYGA